MSLRDWLQLSDLGLAQTIDYTEKNAAETDPTLVGFAAARAQLSRLSWDSYAEAIGCDRGPLSHTGVLMWPIDDGLAARLIDAFSSSPKASLRRDDFAIGYFSSTTTASCEHLNRANDYREWTPALSALLDQALPDLAPRLQHELGHPFRVVSSRAFDLVPNTNIAGRHLDGWPPSIRKLFVLPRGASRNGGTTWFRGRDGQESLIESDSPVIVVFENSVVWHAPQPAQQLRPTVELDLAPSTATVARTYYAGLNGWYPWFPTEAAFLAGTRAAAQIAAARGRPEWRWPWSRSRR